MYLLELNFRSACCAAKVGWLLSETTDLFFWKSIKSQHFIDKLISALFFLIFLFLPRVRGRVYVTYSLHFFQTWTDNCWFSARVASMFLLRIVMMSALILLLFNADLPQLYNRYLPNCLSLWSLTANINNFC